MEKGAPESQTPLSTSRNNLCSVTPSSASNPRLYDPNPQYPNEPPMNQQSPPPYYDNFSQPSKAPANTMYPQPQPQDYLPPNGQPGAYSQPYYPQAPPPQPYYSPQPQPQQPQQPQGQQQQQQQSTTVVMAGNDAPAVVQPPRSYLNFTGALVLSCISIWVCCSVCGCIAFVLAVIGQSSACSGDNRNARHMLYASYGLSIVGTIIFVVIIIVCIIVIPAGVVRAPDLHDVFSRTTCPPLTICSYGSHTDNAGCNVCCTKSNKCTWTGSYYNKNGIEVCCLVPLK